MKAKKDISFLRLFWIIFLISIALLLVYLYKLYTDGLLIKRLLQTANNIEKMIKKNPIIFWGVISYIVVFYIGYYFGKKR
ncbi:hypothetical protein ACQKCU_01365 [Heyndrickxia sporothermodurans]